MMVRIVHYEKIKIEIGTTRSVSKNLFVDFMGSYVPYAMVTHMDLDAKEIMMG